MLALVTVPLSRAADGTARSIEGTREYRTRLIADVVTGKLDVREAAAKLHDEADAPEVSGEPDEVADGDGVEDAGVEAEGETEQ